MSVGMAIRSGRARPLGDLRSGGAARAASDVRGRVSGDGQSVRRPEALWFMVILMLGKVLASSLTLSIGGSGGVFAPSLFIGAMLGVAFGTVAHNLLGPSVGPPAIYAVVAMGGVFAAAAQAPLTAIASVAEMTGNFTLTLPIMLACGIAAAVSKQLSYGSIYTTKLLRRGIDIERPRATSALESFKVADVMQPLRGVGDHEPVDRAIMEGQTTRRPRGCGGRRSWAR